MATTTADHQELTFHWHEDVEDLERYCHGGYHPVHLDDEFANGRYRVVHKLGFGTHSTVWLARDELEKKYVALKIGAATADLSMECSILRQLSDARKDEAATKGAKFVASLLDKFSIDGPNGRHICLVSEPAGCTVADSKEASNKWMFPVTAAQTIVAQLIEGMAFIHGCGVVQGDLHARNILFRLDNLEFSSTEELYNRLGEPQKTSIQRLDGRPPGPEAPRYSVCPAFTAIPSDEILNPQVLICDFGEAFLADEGPRHQLHTPLLLCPPEMIFADARVGQPADVWTLGCTIYDIMGERPLFEGWMPDRDDVAAEIVSALGKPPTPWWDGWQNRNEFFLEDGTWNFSEKRCHDARSRSLETRVKDNGRELSPDYGAEDQVALIELLRGMLRYSPEERMTMAEITESEWMERYGGITCKIG